MKWIKLDATPSTNAYLKKLLEEQPCSDPIVVITDSQTQGRGQQGTYWASEKGKNLTMSYLCCLSVFPAHRQFDLNMAVSLGVLDVLMRYNIPELQLKWPNDILSSTAKIGGVLIENQIKGKDLKRSIIGLGLNVNQENFPGLPRASSLLNVKKDTYSVEILAKEIIKAWDIRLERLMKMPPRTSLLKEYEKNLLGYREFRTYRRADGSKFNAELQGVLEDGRLILQQESKVPEYYGLKEIEWVWN